MSEFDSPWKEALDRFLPLFLQFFFPDAHADIDWQRGYEALDKELAQIVREAKSKKRFADKLFKVWRKNGEETWVLIHVEVQAQTEVETTFTKRIYRYNYRIFDRFERPVATMVVLGDEDRNWRPTEFGYTIWGTKALLQFPIVKLLDYADRQEELEQHDNPFALVVLAHLQSQATKNDSQSRRAWKLRLAKNLLNRGLTPEDVRQLFRIIDWLLELPEELTRSFWDEIQDYEEEKKMPVFTSTEKYLINKGRKQGREEGKKEGRKEGEKEGMRKAMLQAISDWLQKKFGDEGAELMPAVETIKDLKKLRAVQQALWDATSAAQVKKLLASKKQSKN